MIRTTEKYAYFYREWPSNFARAKFVMDGIEFFCTEQAFMWLKAKFFHDEETAMKIASVATPMAAKELGRSVRNYDDAEWDRVRYGMMLRVNLLKYRANPDLCVKLLDPRFDGKTFVEESPTDGIWGIRTERMDPADLENESKWAGRNLLGQVITECRNTLLAERQ